jgi:hypothetical protein
MYSGRGTRALPRVSFLIRRSPDQRLVSTSPGLIAATHVLRRLLAPRHPPCALILLIRKNTCMSLWSFQGARGLEPAVPRRSHCRLQGRDQFAKREPAQRGLSKLNSVTTRRGRRCSRRIGGSGRRTCCHLTVPMPTGVIAPVFPRKEVIQPHLPVRLPCYDFTPIIDPTFDGCLLAVSPPASGIADFRGVTGGVYKARERIHRGVADPRLLATPPSWRRVSASNPNRDRLFGIRSPSQVCSPLYRPM